MLNIYKILLFLLISILVQSSWAYSFRKMEIEPILKKRIQALVEMTKDLHEFTYTSNKTELKPLLEKLETHVRETKKIVIDDGPAAKYLIGLFVEMEKSFVKAKDQEKQEQKDTLKIGFEKVVRITQGYRVGNYRTFYCQKFKDLWIQRSWVVKNPVHPKSRCGVLVN